MTTKRKCVFCGYQISPGTGKMSVDSAGNVSFYCSSKCEKNARLKRSPRKVKWTKDYREEKDIRLQHLKEAGKADSKGKKSKGKGGKSKEEKAAGKGEKESKKAKKKSGGKKAGKTKAAKNKSKSNKK